MHPGLVLGIIGGYFGLLILISYLTSGKGDSKAFFTGNRQSPWYLVAFGMIGASLSGVTFISVPGIVGATNFTYMQLVLGYLLGYYIIAKVLLPLYYKYNLISIYQYLETRYGFWSYKTGAFFFLVSQVIGASFRLFLVAGVLQLAIFDSFNIPFEVSVFITITLIWVYTFKGGIKTIIWTDTLQTFFMLAAVVTTIILISKELGFGTSAMINAISESEYSTMFDWDWQSKTNFFKQFFSGAFIAIVMTGLDQNMMQKNLTVKSLKDAQKNMYWFSTSLVFVNIIFLGLGVLLFIYAQQKGITIPERTDDLYALLALNHLGMFAGVTFLLGITAAAYSSADSALTALTTSFSVDFLGMDAKKDNKKQRILTHLGFSFVLFLVIVIFKAVNNQSVISAVFTMAGYTYGPLLGMFAFGLFTKRKTIDKFVPFIALISPILTYLLSINSEALLNGYKFGFELLMVNGLIMFTGLWVFSKKS
ncbi:Sodium/iodide co-transporter [hydrothermal vent metagenome]|uniref:Sodium/iodide co-transporter n=1 Tax=hydrothermal vent metagenome TaxID=652676 RepID=A0A3B0UE16_9ZZZZ